jgi:hypothetical protein
MTDPTDTIPTSTFNQPSWPSSLTPPTAVPLALPKRSHHLRTSLIVLATILGVVVIAGVALHVTSQSPSTKSVVPGTSLVAFEAQMKTELGEAQPTGWAVSGVSSVTCALPQAWVPGTVFDCTAYDSDGNGLGTMVVTIQSTAPGAPWDTSNLWQPIS